MKYTIIIVTATLQFACGARLMDYALSIANEDSEWDNFVRTSPQANVFSESGYLRALDVAFTRYLVRTPHGEIVAGTAILEQDAVMHAAPYPFTPYQGILFAQHIGQQPNHKRAVSEFRLSEFIINQLANRYGNFSMALSPEFTDLRPFAWHNYHAPDAPKFSIVPRYTALLDLNGFDQQDYLTSIRAARRQEYKKAHAIVSETDAVDIFIALYRQTFERQQLAIDESAINLVKRITTSALTGGYGRLSQATLADGQVASINLFLFDRHRAYYLLAANAPALRNSGASTQLMIDNIAHMAARGLSDIDFVGVNSPNRGDFKLSFNPQLAPYHEVKLVAPAGQA